MPKRRPREPVVMCPYYYSGPRSLPFWDEINKLSHDSDRDSLRVLAYALQDIECRVLQLLRLAQQPQP